MKEQLIETKKCSCCGTELKQDVENLMWFCPNVKCDKLYQDI